MTKVLPELEGRLDTLAKSVAEAAGDDLVCLSVYGSAAGGDYRPERSDVNLLVVLETASTGVLERLSPVFQAAWREYAADPFLVTRAELPRLADAFPLKLRRIRETQVVLRGEDQLADIAIEREHLRLRLEQLLRNRVLRLRRSFLAALGDERTMRASLSRVVPGLTAEMETLAHLRGSESDEGAPLREEVMDQLRALRRDDPDVDPHTLYARLLEFLTRAVEVADRLDD